MCMHTDSYNSSWPDNQTSYVARLPLAQATELSAYEYWNGASWQTERLTNVGEKEFIQDVNQGQVYWSAYYGCYVFTNCLSSVYR